MEHQHYHNQQQQQQQQQQQHEDNNGSNGGTGKSSFLCRQSSTRWIPTTDQIRILKDLYYNSGLRSPNAEQIQRISARLRQYGKIEGKNVFYWFQNHKARERQKKRLTVDIATSKFSNNMSSAGFSPTSPAMYGLGHMGSSGAGSLLMERTYRECSLPGGVAVEGNMGWVGVETATVPQFYYHQQRPAAATCYYEDSYYYNHLHQTQQQQEDEEEADAAGIETLPLFPIHSQPGQQDQEGHNNSYLQPYYLGHQEENDLHHHNFHHHILHNNSNCSGMDTSLELSLNSYCAPHGST